MLDREKLLAFLADKARTAPPGPMSLLVLHAVYEGLAQRIKDGEFDQDPAHERKDTDT